MDYCSSCRRHLDGALVCPGCAAYAPDIAPRITDSGILPARPAASAVKDDASGETGARGATAPAARRDGPPREEALPGAGGEEGPPPGTSGGVGGAPPARQGPTVCRGLPPRWKKTRRRAVVATAVALVGGGLAVATVERPSTGRVQAAAPDDGMDTAKARATEETLRPARPVSPAPSPSPTAGTPRRGPLVVAPRAQWGMGDVLMPDPAVSPHPATTTAPPSGAVPSTPGATTPDGSGTAPEQPSAPGADGTAAPGASRSASPPGPTSPPAEICLFALCLG
ncbi:hypothetical protein CUT44_02205 [Streptomyces carminius]|uniref:Uncharacterized protein n=1 Tax=Streptomyces carminius TaxID=2665496 RepID=A0A2M8M1J1_9ACTN|nr:hypothetical protein [Streptomyces carminius]PJE98072.1 hypothetical protein CUT44_10465 [Streptomyces carminius]PJF01898.1 hypothetical protein CUT44_02205 [Streptomyces carminius]